MRLRHHLRDERGFTLPELLVGMTISTLVMLGVGSVLWTANNIQSRAGDEAAVAGYMASLGILFDRDTALAAANAPAKGQAGNPDCSTPIDLGSVSYRTTAAANDGPNWLIRTEGGSDRTVAKLVTNCSWQVLNDSTTDSFGNTINGSKYIVLNITLTGVRHTVISETLKGAPRQW